MVQADKTHQLQSEAASWVVFMAFASLIFVVACDGVNGNRTDVSYYPSAIKSFPIGLVSHFPPADKVGMDSKLFFSYGGLQAWMTLQIEMPCNDRSTEELVKHYSELWGTDVFRGFDLSNPQSYDEAVKMPEIETGSIPTFPLFSDRVIFATKTPNEISGVVIRYEERSIIFFASKD